MFSYSPIQNAVCQKASSSLVLLCEGYLRDRDVLLLGSAISVRLVVFQSFNPLQSTPRSQSGLFRGSLGASEAGVR